MWKLVFPKKLDHDGFARVTPLPDKQIAVATCMQRARIQNLEVHRDLLEVA